MDILIFFKLQNCCGLGSFVASQCLEAVLNLVKYLKIFNILLLRYSKCRSIGYGISTIFSECSRIDHLKVPSNPRIIE